MMNGQENVKNTHCSSQFYDLPNSTAQVDTLMAYQNC